MTCLNFEKYNNKNHNIQLLNNFQLILQTKSPEPDSESEKQEQTDDGIDPAMKHYMDMIQKKKEEEKAVSTHGFNKCI